MSYRSVRHSHQNLSETIGLIRSIAKDDLVELICVSIYIEEFFFAKIDRTRNYKSIFAC